MKKLILSFLAATLTGGVAIAQPATSAEQEASIPRIHLDNLRRYRADGTDTLYLQAAGQWYRATLAEGCKELPWATGIGFDTRGGRTLDRFGTILVEGDRCNIRSLVRSGPPPRRSSRR
jgi:hypothetical protein